ncbi:MAG TPA: chemotaxis protein CheW [Oligoflexus sp.]|uniref:chemotaxis protein CheW n=1 Tax=Oligoflexus sp. TaxID=1971216 RepID=UPI002D4C948F|nr:chemotaxis protein CheW [Oligoflexus sp.]HYX40035.1 chemotaxis protein CheW [Oligoflexus sp.]
MVESGLAQKQYLIFSIASQQCAALLEEICEVVLMAELSAPVGLTESLAGILNLGGEAIPVLKLNRLLGLQEFEVGLYSHIILTRNKEGTVGFLTQAVKKIQTVSTEDLKPLRFEANLNGFALAMLPDGRDFIAVLSLKNIANSCETSVKLNSNASCLKPMVNATKEAS